MEKVYLCFETHSPISPYHSKLFGVCFWKSELPLNILIHLLVFLEVFAGHFLKKEVEFSVQEEIPSEESRVPWRWVHKEGLLCSLQRKFP